MRPGAPRGSPTRPARGFPTSSSCRRLPSSRPWASWRRSSSRVPCLAFSSPSSCGPSSRTLPTDAGAWQGMRRPMQHWDEDLCRSGREGLTHDSRSASNSAANYSVLAGRLAEPVAEPIGHGGELGACGAHHVEKLFSGAHGERVCGRTDPDGKRSLPDSTNGPISPPARDDRERRRQSCWDGRTGEA